MELLHDEYHIRCETGEYDCVGIMLDTIGLVSASGVAVACLPGLAVCGTAMAVGGTVGIVSGGLGVAWTANQLMQGKATEDDLAVSAATFVVGATGPVGRSVAPSAVVISGWGASVFQLSWDFLSSD